MTIIENLLKLRPLSSSDRDAAYNIYLDKDKSRWITYTALTQPIGDIGID